MIGESLLIIKNLESKHPTEDAANVFSFQTGTGEFKNSYFLQVSSLADLTLYQNLGFGLGLNRGMEQSVSTLTLADSAGIEWKIDYEKGKYLIYKNDSLSSFDIDEFIATQLKPLQGGQIKDFSLSRYQLSVREGDVFFQPLKSEENDHKLVHNYVLRNMKQILDSYVLSFSSEKFGKFSQTNSLGKKLTPIYKDYQGICQDKEKLEGDQLSIPKNIAVELSDTKMQVELMDNIQKYYDEVIKNDPHFKHAHEKLQKLNSVLEENMKYCKLTKFPAKSNTPDWNVPLQCLCYLNVLDKMIPVLEEGVGKFNDHFAETTNVINKERQSVYQLKSSLIDSLKVYIRECEGKTKVLSETRREKSFVEKIKHMIVDSDESVDLDKDHIRHYSSLKSILENVAVSISKIEQPPVSMEHQFKDMEEFLNQSLAKRDNLKRHWQKICVGLNISEDISLHEFLNFILKYNELIILNQKTQEISQMVEKRNYYISKIKELLALWYEKTGSQKIVNLSSQQIILNEAQNILRYKQKKEEKLDYLMKNQLDLECRLRMTEYFDEKLEDCKNSWKKVFVDLDFPLIEIDDKRIPMFIEKHGILSTFSFIQNQLIENKQKCAFIDEWDYEDICFWHLNAVNLSEQDLALLERKLHDLPKYSIHIFFVLDGFPFYLLKQLGFGQITHYSERPKKTYGGVEYGESTDLDLSLSPPKKPQKPIVLHKDKKIQAVLDILNGN